MPLKGDRLEILLVEPYIDELLTFGDALVQDSSNRNLTPRLDKLIRDSIELKEGVPVLMLLENGEDYSVGRVVGVHEEEGQPAQYKIKFTNNQIHLFPEDNVRNSVVIHDAPERRQAIAKILPVNEYLRRRLQPEAHASHHDGRKIAEAVRWLDPSHLAANPHLQAGDVRAMAANIRIIANDENFVRELEGRGAFGWRGAAGGVAAGGVEGLTLTTCTQAPSTLTARRQKEQHLTARMWISSRVLSSSGGGSTTPSCRRGLRPRGWPLRTWRARRPRSACSLSSRQCSLLGEQARARTSSSAR